MSNIDKQIEFLKNQKKKIDFYKFIKSKVNSHKDVEKGVKDEVSKVLNLFIDSKVKALEDNEDEKPLESSNVAKLTDFEINVLKDMVLKVSSRNKEPNKEAVQEPVKRVLKSNKMEANEKLAFRDEWMHLAETKVTVQNPDTGDQLLGLVVGLDAPNLKLQLENGREILVPPQHII